jgi:hypothetical protein
MAIPAMSIIATLGILWMDDEIKARWSNRFLYLFRGLIALAFFFSLTRTYTDYYLSYTYQKTPDFEGNRMRGHFAISDWLKRTYPGKDKPLVVLSDPITVSSQAYIFHTFKDPFPYIFWTYRFTGKSNPKEVLDWENDILKQYPKIVYIFCYSFFRDTIRNEVVNDWRPFLTAHPEERAVYSYSYSTNSPPLMVFEIDKTQNAAAMAGKK